MPEGKTPYEMLYEKKPDLKDLREWGSKVWVHTTEGSKLDGRLKVGKWVGFDESSSAHRIYWLERRYISIERSIKFDNGDVLVPLSIARPIQGETESVNQQRDSFNQSEEHLDEPTPTETSKQILESPKTDSETQATDDLISTRAPSRQTKFMIYQRYQKWNQNC